jgi:hypothetical protein
VLNSTPTSQDDRLAQNFKSASASVTEQSLHTPKQQQVDRDIRHDTPDPEHVYQLVLQIQGRRDYLADQLDKLELHMARATALYHKQPWLTFRQRRQS